MILASFATTILSITIIIVCVLLVGLILLQKNRGAGLSGAFGGVGGHSAFGTKTGDMLTWVTVGLAAVFLVLAIVGNYFFVPEVPALGPPATELPMTTEQLPAAQDTAPAPAQSAIPVSPAPAPVQAPPAPAPQPSPAPAPASPAPGTTP